MSDSMSIKVNVDTINDGAAFFVRTEVDTHTICIQGPFADLKSAQQLKAEQLATREKVSETLKDRMWQVLSAWTQRRS